MKSIKYLISLTLIFCVFICNFSLVIVYGFDIDEYYRNSNEMENVTMETLKDMKNLENIESYKYLIEKDSLFLQNEELDGSNIISREQFLIMFFRLMTNKKIALISESPYYCDVEPSDWFAGYIEWGRYNCVAYGIDEYNWGVGLDLNREQMYQMVYNFVSSRKLNQEQNFYETDIIDIDIVSNWAKKAVLWVNSADLIIEDEENICNSIKKVTYNEAVYFLKSFDLYLDSQGYTYEDLL